MIPLLALAVPTIVETLVIATTTALATTVTVRLTNDAYDAVTKKEDKQ